MIGGRVSECECSATLTLLEDEFLGCKYFPYTLLAEKMAERYFERERKQKNKIKGSVCFVT